MAATTIRTGRTANGAKVNMLAQQLRQLPQEAHGIIVTYLTVEEIEALRYSATGRTVLTDHEATIRDIENFVFRRERRITAELFNNGIQPGEIVNVSPYRFVMRKRSI